jgi:site-specific DNA recombinase
VNTNVNFYGLLIQHRDWENRWMDWSDRNNGYLDWHRRATERVAELEAMKRERLAKNLRIDAFIRDLASCPLAIDELDERLWAAAVEAAIVTKDGRLVFRFKDGTVL